LTHNPPGITKYAMTNLKYLTTIQLREIIAIMEQIEKLQNQMDSIVGGGEIPIKATVEAPKKRRMSRAGRAAIAAAARARWARVKGKGKGKRRLSAAGRAAIIAATKASWAKVKAAKKKDRRSSPAVRAKLAAAARARWRKARAEGRTRL
jgi:hypothetical protein